MTMYKAEILLDSVSPAGARLTTFEITYPLIVHQELMTHRDFSRNAASSRAIPVKRMIESVVNNPFVPEQFPKNQKGMQASKYYEPGTDEYEECKRLWLGARDRAVAGAIALSVGMDVHKQISNRLLYSWQWITVVVSATRWSNFFTLRCHPDAQPEIRKIAEMMRDAYEASEPHTRSDFHCPYTTQEERNRARIGELDKADLYKMSVARCARVSYRTHATDTEDARVPTIAEDIALADRLIKSGHWSPTEHVAFPAADAKEQSGNFTGWIQYRKYFQGECR